MIYIYIFLFHSNGCISHFESILATNFPEGVKTLKRFNNFILSTDRTKTKFE